MNRYVTAVGKVGWEADSRGIEIAFRRRTRRLRWGEITAAGLICFSSPDEISDIPTDILPGLGRLIELNRWQAREQRQLVLARGRSTFRAVRVPVPIKEPAAMALVEEVRRNLGDRWIGELPMQDHQPALGLSTPWWFYPLFGLGFVAFGLTILVAIAAWAALTDGDWAAVPPVAWLALFLWLALIGAALFLYRGRG